MVILRCFLKVARDLNNLRTFPNITYPCRSVSRTIRTTSQLNDQPNSSSSSELAASPAEVIDNELVPQDPSISEASSLPSSPSRRLTDDAFPDVPLEALGIRSPNALDICSDNVSHAAPPLQPSVSFAAYVNDSPTLQELVKLDVQLWKLEKKPRICNYILGLDYDRDIKNHLLFLHKLGVPGDKFGFFITHNPLIFKEDISNLQIRVNYLESKRFTGHEIAAIVAKNPRWLSYSTQEIDSRLGFLQQVLNLKGPEVRRIAVAAPDVVTRDTSTISVLAFSLKEEMGFTDEDIRTMTVTEPKLLSFKLWSIKQAFDEIHNNIGIAHDVIVKQPQVLTCPPTTCIRHRHLFLKMLKRDQYNPKKENYVSLLALTDGTDVDFCKNVAKTSVESFNIFLKAL